jgi:glucuronate isomerase
VVHYKPVAAADPALRLHPDRLLPPSSEERAIASHLYDAVSDLPVISPHAPDAMRRFRAAVTETAGFSRTSGFIDDTRAFCSIPARHDMSRRLDAGWVAELVAEHRLDADEAVEVAVDLATGRPTAVFKL